MGERSKGNAEQTEYAATYRQKVESELQQICDTVLGLLTNNLTPLASAAESKVFYHKMKGDYYRYIAEFTVDTDKLTAADNARKSYDEAMEIAKADLAVTHPIRLGLALNFSVFHYEVLGNPEEACKMARSSLGSNRGTRLGGGGDLQRRNFDHAVVARQP